MQTQNQTQIRLSWRLSEIAKASGLSVPFLRKEVREGKLQVRKIGGAVIVLDSEVRRYLAGEPIKSDSHAAAA